MALRPADEVIVAKELAAPEGRAMQAQERELASQLVGALAGTFRHEEFQDDYRERVLDLVKRKQHGKKVTLVRFEPNPAGSASLVGKLKASIKAAG